MAVSHLSRPIAESSKIVPTFTENCFRHSRHVHIRRVVRNDRRLQAHRGHSGPFGHLALDTASKQIMVSEKYQIASIKPVFSLKLTVSIPQVYYWRLCESSNLLPFLA